MRATPLKATPGVAKHLCVVHQARAKALDLLHGSDCTEGNLSEALHEPTHLAVRPINQRDVCRSCDTNGCHNQAIVMQQEPGDAERAC